MAFPKCNLYREDIPNLNFSCKRRGPVWLPVLVEHCVLPDVAGPSPGQLSIPGAGPGNLLPWKAPDLETDFDKRMMKLREHFQPGKVLPVRD